MKTLGNLAEAMDSGKSIMKIAAGNRVYRYSASHPINRALTIFDKTNKWTLPPGEYTLLPVRPSHRLDSKFNHNRKIWDSKKRKKRNGKLKVFQGRSLPTRKSVFLQTFSRVAD